MQQRIYYPTTHVATVDSYPYGRLRTTAYFGTEFKTSKGYRSTFQTINPKNGRKNAVKNSTYYTIMVMYQNTENGHYDHIAFRLDSDESINKCAKFCYEHFDLFDIKNELPYIYLQMLMATKASMKSSVIYSGAKPEHLIPLYDASVTALVEALELLKKGGISNTFHRVVIDAEAVKACSDPNYQPFKVSETFKIGANGMEQIPVQA